MQTEMQTALILIRLFLFTLINRQIYKTHIKPQKPALIKLTGLGFMIKPGFYAKPDA